jgi:glycoprotein endo-alpha-1,2-mannosidase
MIAPAARSPRGSSSGMHKLLVTALVALLAPTGHAAPAAPRTAIFYYPWYGSAAVDGSYEHWDQAGHKPPMDIASNYYPARGTYSSSSPAVLQAQMREIAGTGVEEVISSWWGWGSAEDTRLPAVIEAARAAGLQVAVHIEPYEGRTAASVAADIEHLRTLGITDFYVYRAADQAAADWAQMNVGLTGVRVFAQTNLPGFAAAGKFTGLYTYDVLLYGGASFRRICAAAHRLQLLCAPSVGPGYSARVATGDLRVKPRLYGLTYDSMWRAALAAPADLVTITSYNEWSEGTQIEPAAADASYENYDGTYGLMGRAAERAYLVRTAYWVARMPR